MEHFLCFLSNQTKGQVFNYSFILFLFLSCLNFNYDAWNIELWPFFFFFCVVERLGCLHICIISTESNAKLMYVNFLSCFFRIFHYPLLLLCFWKKWKRDLYIHLRKHVHTHTYRVFWCRSPCYYLPW